MVVRASHILKPIVHKMLVFGFIKVLLAAFGLFCVIELPSILQGISGVTPPLLEYFPDVVDVSRTNTTDDDFMDPADDYGDSGSVTETAVLDMHWTRIDKTDHDFMDPVDDYGDNGSFTEAAVLDMHWTATSLDDSSFIGNPVLDCMDYSTILAVFSTFLAGVLLLLPLSGVLFWRQMKGLRRQKKYKDYELQELRMKIQENDDLMTDHNLVQEEVSRLRLELASSKQTTAELQEKLSHKNQVLKNLHSVIQDRKAEMKKNDTEKKLFKYLQGVESQMEQLKNQNEKLQVDKEDLKKELDLHAKEAANFKEKLEARDKEIENHLQQIEEGSSKLDMATQTPTETSLPSRQEEAQPTSDRITRGKHEKITPPSPERITRHRRIVPPSPERITQGVHKRITMPSPDRINRGVHERIVRPSLERITRDRHGRIVLPDPERITRSKHERILPP